MSMRIRATALAVLLTAGPAVAQVSTDPRQELMLAIRLPAVTHEARALGVPEPELLTVFRAARDLRLPVADLTVLLREGNDAVRRHGPIDNFGAFVQSRLDAGLRGRELAAAIRAEHQARGIGKGRRLGAGKPGGPPDEVGRPGRPGERGRGEGPDERGRVEREDERGRPDTRGESGGRRDRSDRGRDSVKKGGSR